MEDSKPENSQTYKLWQYCLDICEYMYNEGLIDRQEFLQSVFEMVERCRDPNDPILRILMPVILQVRHLKILSYHTIDIICTKCIIPWQLIHFYFLVYQGVYKFGSTVPQTCVPLC